MLKKILDYIQKYHMIEEGDTIVAGISGGADSVCLLFVLLEIQKKISFAIEVVHINHGIRPEASEDARFVEELCRRKGIPFYLTEENVKERAGQSGRSEEEEGRLVRYQAFRQVLGDRKGRIAVAHNSNDRAETMLFHLFRGTGLAGAGGIPPVNGSIIRPLLCVGRKEIEAWLAERGIDFCTDCTNAQDIYTRNRIRHHILNYAEENICKGTVANMNRTADQFMEAEEYLVRQTIEAVGRCVSMEEQRICINIPDFLKEDEYLQGRILLWCLEQAAGSKKDLTAAHIQSVKTLFAKQGNGEIHLPYELIVYKKYDLGMIERKTVFDQQSSSPKEGALPEEYEVRLPVLNESTHFELPGVGHVEITAFSKGESQNIPEKTYTKWFDYDKITKSAVFRTKRPGDYLTINRKLGRKSLQDYFVNEKVPRENRDNIYLLADGSHIIWVPGYRISEYYKIKDETRIILQVKISEKTSKEERSHSNG
ncbi:MAG: tRNA lysidine(34) synthetase TilS [Lachnospiraceae bacterium]|nr:tRNA lysidine(34) synthetase TilS [Lachnospiraceae bacterium]